MICKIEDVYNAIDKLADFSKSEVWDNTGLLIGSKGTAVTAVLVALDLTQKVLDEAKTLGANLIVTHHPVIYPSLKRIDGDSLVHRLIREDIAVICAHTNYDRAESGVNDSLAKLLELQDIRVLESAELSGVARIGELASPMTPKKFAEFVKSKLNCKYVKYTQGTDITSVAIGGGSCAELWEAAFEAGAQAFVTAEVKHHYLLAAETSGFTLIDAGHFSTEVIAVPPLAEQLSQALPNAKIFASRQQTDPANYA